MSILKAIREAEKERFKILVVDYRPENLDLTKQVLEREGHIVFTATNAGETLSMLDTSCPEGLTCFDSSCKANNCFDAVIITYDLPDITGATLGAFIRNKFKDISITLLSDYGKLPTILRAANQINAQILQKPIEPEELLKEVTESIRKERKTRNNAKSSVTGDTVRHILRIATASRDLRHT